jgi:hypothetical protein
MPATIRTASPSVIVSTNLLGPLSLKEWWPDNLDSILGCGSCERLDGLGRGRTRGLREFRAFRRAAQRTHEALKIAPHCDREEAASLWRLNPVGVRDALWREQHVARAHPMFLVADHHSKLPLHDVEDLIFRAMKM